MHLIRYEGRVTAIVGRDDIVLIQPVADLADEDPVRRWVLCLAFVARELERGNLEGVYTEARANRFARLALIPDEAFDARAGADDRALATFFNVPVGRIVEKRIDRQPISSPGTRAAALRPER